ncbi:MAG: excinuclease ABC subunit UvrB [Prevotellaceae bacterium]|jgi:excinuclease ABC subunit B|nr:excinuclease ABC subunit UvrB [Prevotellaceae bacterium]
MDFKLISAYQPTGDQPEAIAALVSALSKNVRASTLLGVTGSGKTFTMANVIARTQRPTLILSHNKTLAAQLYGEFKAFFPENAVEYFVSYYDYYQPEAYLPISDTYIEKDLSINDEIEKLRLSATSSLLSGRRDVIVVSSVSCLYGIGNPEDFLANTMTIKRGQLLSRNKFLYALVDALYSRNDINFERGTFRVKGDTVDVYLAYGDFAYRIVFWGDEIEKVETFEPVGGRTIDEPEEVHIYPANIFSTTKERMHRTIHDIQDDMLKRCNYFHEIGKPQEAKRLKSRVEYDLEMIKEIGYCSGIENYSRYFDGRNPGSRPFCLLDYFAKDFITFIDESHVTVSQIRAMYGGDRSRKQTLIDYGFRLPAAADNRPLKFEEFDALVGQRVYVSATPADFELQESEGVVIEQVVRPTGLLDPVIEVRPTGNQIDNLVEEIAQRAAHNERILVTTLTKRMAEELTKYFERIEIRCRYIHSDVDTLERIQILEDLQRGLFDVLVGVNLLREGLDLPQVSLVAILDADKEGFLRSSRALTQTAGRAARNLNGKVIMYADTVTDSMQQTMDETARCREKQIRYNIEHSIIPQQVSKTNRAILGGELIRSDGNYALRMNMDTPIAADPVLQQMNNEQLDKTIIYARKQMEQAAKELDFVAAACFRDEMYALMQQKEKNNKIIWD